MVIFPAISMISISYDKINCMSIGNAINYPTLKINKIENWWWFFISSYYNHIMIILLFSWFKKKRFCVVVIIANHLNAPPNEIISLLYEIISLQKGDLSWCPYIYIHTYIYTYIKIKKRKREREERVIQPTSHSFHFKFD